MTAEPMTNVQRWSINYHYCSGLPNIKAFNCLGVVLPTINRMESHFKGDPLVTFSTIYCRRTFSAGWCIKIGMVE